MIMIGPVKSPLSNGLLARFLYFFLSIAMPLCKYTKKQNKKTNINYDANLHLASKDYFPVI